ncbi:T9SS type A sorting domain-containing protein [Puia sp. P3]|uniref:T9SS type A sorting domain-containing protein n=1 Tax=Puia sp. P3 TaxID=3423952 RepID=UPI003D67E1D0
MKRIRAVVTLWVCLLFALTSASRASAQMISVYASPNGSASGDGSISSPVSLDRAAAIVRTHPQTPCTVWLADGTYKQVKLGPSDSRSSSAAVTYQAVSPHGAVILPENVMDLHQFKPIPDSIRNRIINTTAKGKVRQLPLSALSLNDTADWPLMFTLSNLRSPKFYRNGNPLPMSRYPQDTTMTMGEVISKGKYKTTPGGSFRFKDDRVQQWQKAIEDGGLFLCGNWQFTWKLDVVKTLSVDTKGKLIKQAIGLQDGIGTQDPGRLAPGTEPYYALNLVEEINAEGQWSINFRTKMLYMWVPETGSVTMDGDSQTPSVDLDSVSNTSFIGIDVRGGSGDAYELNHCKNILIAGSHISLCSGYGVRIADGSSCTVQSNDINQVGAGGVIITSSSLENDQSALRGSGHQVINNHIYNYATEAPVYSAAIDVSSAVGAYVAYNKVHDCPHVGIMHGGNNNILEYNEVYDVVKKYTDMGAFYKFQKTPTGWNARGNKIRHNYIHDAPRANGVYEDDCASGDSINHNIIANTVMATYNHNGYFNNYSNTIYFGNTYPATSMVETPGSAGYSERHSGLGKIWNNSSAYKGAYPEVGDMIGSAGRNNKYNSRIWPSIIGSVFVGAESLSNVNGDKLFNADGTTNPEYAETGAPFKKDNVVFKNNRRVLNRLQQPIVPFRIDSLRAAGVFAMTGDSDWHINRIGLHKDKYRTDISSVKTEGIDPSLTVAVTGKPGGASASGGAASGAGSAPGGTGSGTSGSTVFKTSDTVRLTAGIKSPNAGYIFSSVKFMENNKDITKDLIVSKKLVSYDSVKYNIEWKNPAVGTHRLTMHGYDGTIWEYTSNAVVFTVEGDTTKKPKDSIVTPKPKPETPKTTPVPPTTTPVPPAATPAPPADSTPVAQPSKQGSSNIDNIDMGHRKMVVYPNPASSVLNLAYWSTQPPGNVKTMIYDNGGRQITGKAVFMQTGQNQVSYNVTSLANGIYVLLVENPDHTIASQRFIVAH